MIIVKEFSWWTLLIVVTVIEKRYAVNSCRKYSPYNKRMRAPTSLTPELVDCFESCNREKACKGMSLRKEAHPQCGMFMGEFPPQLGSFNNVWIKECPEGFVRNIYEQQCYMLVETKRSWYQAEEYCRNKNAYLAELIETEEREAAWNYVKERGARSVWLGAVQNDPLAVGHRREYKWKRSNISIPTTIAAVWYVPIDHPESCGLFRGGNPDSRFYDEACSSLIWFLCEW